ncbi:MAG: outer membrane protein [Pyrinomonadaceae bacterium]|jgi:Skp family chaperone for outer membrane proteins|nr:outer membrane protein [Pyrinomonadaceae bacterium]MDQ1590218.1 outer membrane protein [Pyrinomonadaceae bacterium]MDQ1613644.1 outer membrane protein [Pyrinomonadaceae bacterium]MDX6270481.1 outer membrane protein [Acidobacteriota bacterium]
MKLFRLIAAAGLVAASLVISASAQTAARPQPAAPAAGQGTAPASTARIAIIDSSAFSDEKAGIGRVVNAMKTVDAQFQPVRTEVQGMQTRYQALVDDINKTSAVADPKTIQAKTDQADTLKRDIERKTQDAQIAIKKRMDDVLGPLQEDVYTSLQAFAQQRGISIIIDASRVPLIYAADSVDITKDFIAEYNRTKPATASAAPAGGAARPAGRP